MNTVQIDRMEQGARLAVAKAMVRFWRRVVKLRKDGLDKGDLASAEKYVAFWEAEVERAKP